ncbi:Abscisic acid 8'-hydroxylase 3 isoform A [Glycine soja]|nr:Abscisic acid 8'-hydroxylase 3 isoform A [Glycine soja]
MLGCSEIVGKLKKFSCLIGVSCRNDDITASVAEFDAWPFEEEHRRIIENRKSGTNLTWSEVNNMPYTAKVISETLRRATILPCFSRKASQDFEINGYKVRKGWSINLDVVSIHHDPEVFSNPEKFDPSRFDEPLRPFSFLGFGSGPRMCPRMNLAKLEICVFIYHLINKYTLLIMESTSSGRQIMLG